MVSYKNFHNFIWIFVVIPLIFLMLVGLPKVLVAADAEQTISNTSGSTEKAKEGNASSSLKDGKYEGRTDKDYRGTVVVTVKDGKISEIQAFPQGKDRQYKKEIDAILKKILESQQYQVDAYTGATKYTIAIVSAVQNALRTAKQE